MYKKVKKSMPVHENIFLQNYSLFILNLKKEFNYNPSPLILCISISIFILILSHNYHYFINNRYFFEYYQIPIQALNSHARKNQMKISTNPLKTSVLAFNLQIVPG
jgi:hypothetical protein